MRGAEDGLYVLSWPHSNQAPDPNGSAILMGGGGIFIWSLPAAVMYEEDTPHVDKLSLREGLRVHLKNMMEIFI